MIGNGNDVNVAFGYVGVLDAPNQNEVVVRFNQTLPSDAYQINISPALKNLSGDTFANGGTDAHVPLDFTLDLARAGQRGRAATG